ncbi:regulator of G-protein signaling 16 isoform X1 [Anser cygnoides]|uniref:regulator of G-protein signaling 16 isoform X1 n=1 Tax=Anser cygnoides TaxID=8845 RepID=UPI0020090C90|nr:regulator of G-protein signaling 16 isoform X3 [Anser cygnoides]
MDGATTTSTAWQLPQNRGAAAAAAQQEMLPLCRDGSDRCRFPSVLRAALRGWEGGEGAGAKELKSRLGILLHKPELAHRIGAAGKLQLGSRQRDSSREVLEWRESFDQLLKSKNGVTAFHTFLKTEFSEENLDFWLACEDFKKTRSKTKLASKANRIFEEFVQSEAPREVNIDHETREITRKNLSGATSACFNEAQAKTRTLMEKDSYPRFLKSASYQDMTKQAASRGTSKRLHT